MGRSCGHCFYSNWHTVMAHASSLEHKILSRWSRTRAAAFKFACVNYAYHLWYLIDQRTFVCFQHFCEAWPRRLTLGLKYWGEIRFLLLRHGVAGVLEPQEVLNKLSPLANSGVPDVLRLVQQAHIICYNRNFQTIAQVPLLMAQDPAVARRLPIWYASSSWMWATTFRSWCLQLMILKYKTKFQVRYCKGTQILRA